MSLIYRTEKGAPLSAKELDDNFRQLHGRIKELENAERVIHRISASEDHLILKDSAGVEISRVKIPVISLNSRGEWRDDVPYARNDLVTYLGDVMICTHSHGPSTFNITNWQKLFNQGVKNANE